MAAPPTPAPPPKADMAPILQQLSLTALRTRMHDLQATLSRIIHSIHTNPSTKWAEVLGQFAIVNLELLSLVDDIKPILKAFVVFPKNVNAENAPILPIMLSSKLLPELEAEETALKEHVLTPMSNLPLHVQTDKLQKQIELFRTVCDTAEKVLGDSRKSYGLGTRQGLPPIPTIDKAQAARILEQEKQLHAAANFGDGLRISATEQRSTPSALPPHIAAALASSDDGTGTGTTGFTRGPPQTGGVRPTTPQQMISGASLTGTPAAAAMAYANSPRPGGFGEMHSQQQQQQQQQALLMQKAKFQKPFIQQQQQQHSRQPATPPLPQMQATNQAGPQSLLQQSKMHQFPQSHLQLNQQQHAQLHQHLQERQQQFQLQQQLQGRAQMAGYGNPLASNMVANLSQQQSRMQQYGAAMSGQPQRNQLQQFTDPMYMGTSQTAANLGLPQATYNLMNQNQNALTPGSFHHATLLNQNTLLNPNAMPTFNQVRQQQQQQPPPSAQ